MERFIFPDAVMKNWAVNATELLNCLIEGELSVCDAGDPQMRLRLEDRNGSLYLRKHSLPYFPAHYTISHNLCVFRLSELEIFAKACGLPSFQQRNEPQQIGSGEDATDKSLAEKNPAKMLRPSQSHREACRAVAKRLWKQDPTITIHDMGYRNEINALLGGKNYSDATFREWFKNLCPNRAPGRRKKN